MPEIDEYYRLRAIAKYHDRDVVPLVHTETAGALTEQQGSCGLDLAGGPGNCGAQESGADPEATPLNDFMLRVADVPGHEPR